MKHLNAKGKEVLEVLERHCRENLKMKEVDVFTLGALANSIALYIETCEAVNDFGYSNTYITSKGQWVQIRPEYTVMNKELDNIRKLSERFGLTPGDREKIFKGLQKAEKKKAFAIE